MKELESKTHVSVCRVCWHGAHIVPRISINDVEKYVDRFDEKKRVQRDRFGRQIRVSCVSFHVNFREGKINLSLRGNKGQKSNTIQSRYRYELVKIQKHDHIYQVHNLRISFVRLIDVLCHIPVQSAVANTNDSELCINRRPFGCAVNRFNLLSPASSVSFIIIRVTVECGQPEAVFSIIFLQTRQKPTAITPNMKRHCVRSSQSAVRAIVFRLMQIV